MDIHVDMRGFLEIHECICSKFSDQGTSVVITVLYQYSVATESFPLKKWTVSCFILVNK